MVNDKLLETLRDIAQYCKPFPISRVAQEAIDEIERLRSATSARPAPVRTAAGKRERFHNRSAA